MRGSPRWSYTMTWHPQHGPMMDIENGMRDGKDSRSGKARQHASKFCLCLCRSWMLLPFAVSLRHSLDLRLACMRITETINNTNCYYWKLEVGTAGAEGGPSLLPLVYPRGGRWRAPEIVQCQTYVPLIETCRYLTTSRARVRLRSGRPETSCLRVFRFNLKDWR